MFHEASQWFVLLAAASVPPADVARGDEWLMGYGGGRGGGALVFVLSCVSCVKRRDRSTRKWSSSGCGDDVANNEANANGFLPKKCLLVHVPSKTFGRLWAVVLLPNSYRARWKGSRRPPWHCDAVAAPVIAYNATDCNWLRTTRRWDCVRRLWYNSRWPLNSLLLDSGDIYRLRKLYRVLLGTYISWGHSIC